MKKHTKYQINYKVDMESFYEKLGNTSFKGLDSKKILTLKIISKDLNKFYNNNNLPINIVKKYIKIMNSIKTNPKGYRVNNDAEKYLLFMFSVDPNFEAAKIHGESNNTNETETKMINYFGIYDRKLIILENYFIKNFFNEQKRNEIIEEIERRVHK